MAKRKQYIVWEEIWGSRATVPIAIGTPYEVVSKEGGYHVIEPLIGDRVRVSPRQEPGHRWRLVTEPRFKRNLPSWF